MPRICTVHGIAVDDPCPKKTLLKQLKKALDQLEGLRTCPPLAPILHTRAEVCNCSERKKDLRKTGVVSYSPLSTLIGEEAIPLKIVDNAVPPWEPPIIEVTKKIHPYMSCYDAPEPKAPDCHDCHCRFGIHLHAGNKSRDNHECCYIECEHDKPGFRDWQPKRTCNYPNVCKADCFDHYTTGDYFNFDASFD